LMHTEWNVYGPQPMSQYAIEVARKQADGSWCWLIGDPFTVGRYTKAEPPALLSKTGRTGSESR